MLGSHVIKSYSTTQSVISLSSGEAEYYGAVKGASRLLGLIAMIRDFGLDLTGRITTDSTTAIGIANRRGAGKVRHLEVHLLWLQQCIERKLLAMEKVPGPKNPADVGTKHVTAAVLAICLERLGMRVASSPAEGALRMQQGA